MALVACLLLFFAPLIAFFEQDPYSYEQEEEAPLSLSLNLFGGTNLQLSNGDTYFINPDHRIYSSLWVTPATVLLEKSGDPKYPVRIVNLATGTAVNGRLMTLQEVKRLEQMQAPAERKPGQAPQPPQLSPRSSPPPSPPAPLPQKPKVIPPTAPGQQPKRPMQNTAQKAPQNVPEFIDTPSDQMAPSPEVQAPPPPPPVIYPPEQTFPTTRTPIGPHQPPQNGPLPPEQGAS